MSDKKKEDPDGFTTIYKKDFKAATAKRPPPFIITPEYHDILSGPHEDVLFVKKPDGGSETFSEFRCRLAKKKENTESKMVIPNKIDLSVYEKELEKVGKTVYQVEHCRPEDGFVSARTLNRQRVTLPEGWGPTPRTTYGVSFRDIRHIATWDVTPKAIVPPKASLDPNEKEREILQVKTGESEYAGIIGQLGEEIIAGHYLGKVRTLPHEYIPEETAPQQ